MLPLQDCERLGYLALLEFRARALGDAEELLSMTVRQLRMLPGLLEPLGRVLANRLQHPKPRTELSRTATNQALVE